MVKSWRQMDDNSLAAYPRENRLTREALVFNVYRKLGRALTDRQVKEFLGMEEMNDVRPTITRMTKEVPPRLEKAGETKDHKTGKTVRTVRIAGPRTGGELFDENALRGVKKRGVDTP